MIYILLYYIVCVIWGVVIQHHQQGQRKDSLMSILLFIFIGSVIIPWVFIHTMIFRRKRKDN